jgi:CDP-diacylglycerol pyrophosphatase
MRRVSLILVAVVVVAIAAMLITPVESCADLAAQTGWNNVPDRCQTWP